MSGSEIDRHHDMIDRVSIWIESVRMAPAPTDLSPDEEARAARFHFAADRERWRRGRSWIRHRLAAHLGLTPPELVFAIDASGRPSVVAAPPGFDCNWSHADDWMALAVSPAGPVGIDVEVVRDDFPALEVAAHVFTGAEHAALSACSEGPERQRLFFRLWTAKEALMKATGLGMALDPAAIDMNLVHDRPVGYASHPAWQLAMREDARWVVAVAHRCDSSLGETVPA